MVLLKGCFAVLGFIFFVLNIRFPGRADYESNTVRSEPGNVTISLANLTDTDPSGKAFYEKIKLVPRGDAFIVVEDIPADVSFVIAQIHAPESDLTLSYDHPPFQNASKNGSVSGSNIGLEFNVDGKASTRFFVSNNENASVDALVAVVAYGERAPMPGGCNLEFDVRVSPFQKLTVDAAMITVESQPASAPRINGTVPSCDEHSVKLETYLMYLTTGDYSIETYFDGIRKMMTVEGIVKYGQKTRLPSGASMFHRLYASYPGTGSVYAVIASYENFSAAYVPIATYACSPHAEPSSCEYFKTALEKVVQAVILLNVVAITFMCQSCTEPRLMWIGVISSSLLSFWVSTASGLSPDLTAAVFVTTFLLTAVSVLVLVVLAEVSWVSRIIPTVIVGMLVASTFYFFAGTDFAWLDSDTNFWLTYAGITLLVSLGVAFIPPHAEAFCAGIFSTYALILAYDYSVGSNLKYIIINTIRRLTVHGLNIAVVQPPFQVPEQIFAALFVVFVLLEVHAQTGRTFLCKKKNSTDDVLQDADVLISDSSSDSSD